MLVDDYDHPGLIGCVRVGIGPEILCDQDAKLLIWQRALSLDDKMVQPDWCIRLMDDWADGLGKEWHVQTTINGPVVRSFKAARSIIAAAAGNVHRPAGNAMASITIRDYDDRASDAGTLEWWSRIAQCNGTYSLGGIIAEGLSLMLNRARSAGFELFVEKLSIVLSKDPSAPLVTHTPTLHCDLHYGRREAAIVSVLERGHGTVFFPTLHNTDLADGENLTVQSALKKYPDHPAVSTKSGDMVCYVDDDLLACERSFDKRGQVLLRVLDGDRCHLLTMPNRSGFDQPRVPVSGSLGAKPELIRGSRPSCRPSTYPPRPATRNRLWLAPGFCAAPLCVLGRMHRAGCSAGVGLNSPPALRF